MGWPVLGYLLGKNFWRRDRDHLVPPGGWMQQSAVPRCAILSGEPREASGSETPRVHNVARWHGRRLAARGAGAARRAVKRIGFLNAINADWLPSKTL